MYAKDPRAGVRAADDRCMSPSRHPFVRTLPPSAALQFTPHPLHHPSFVCDPVNRRSTCTGHRRPLQRAASPRVSLDDTRSASYPETDDSSSAAVCMSPCRLGATRGPVARLSPACRPSVARLSPGCHHTACRRHKSPLAATGR